MNFRVADTSRTTGRLLESLVLASAREQGVNLGDAVVSYGVGYTGPLPSLNGRCSIHNKEQQTRILFEGLGPGALRYVSAEEARNWGTRGETFMPLLSRKTTHSRGRDIGVVLEPWQFSPRLAAGANFFTAYEPSVREFRIWMYRNRHLGSYEKSLDRPAEFTKIGRNYGNGFNFNHMEADNVTPQMRDLASRAIAALGLDFGAVDMLQRPDGSFCVLEVNSAPGVAHERRAVINNLAHRIVRWAANNFPARR